jgi:hypothetical protein
MKQSCQGASSNDALNGVVASEQATVREQLCAVWELYIERVRRQLSSDWQEQIEEVIAERFSELTRKVEGAHAADLSRRLEQMRAFTRKDLGERLSAAARRLKQASSREVLFKILTEEAGGFCVRAATVIFCDSCLRVVGAQGFNHDICAALLRQEIPLAAAAAFRNASENMETIVASRTERELSPQLAWLVGEEPSAKVFLFPIVCRGKVAGVLYVDDGLAVEDIGLVEVLAELAGAVLEAGPPVAAATTMELVSITPASRPPARAVPADWTALPTEHRELHLRAQRFARVQVAEIRLYKAVAVQAGRARANLYGELKHEIDAARESFRLQFVVPCTSMVDYLHLELLNTLANHDAALLGPEYPGPLV